MDKTITVATRGEIKKSAKGNTYFLVTDTDGVNYVCFHSAQHPDYPEGAGVYSKITERAGSDATIELANESTVAQTATPPKLPAVDNRTDDIHNQVAYKIAGQVFCALVGAGRFPEVTSAEIAINIGLMAKEIKLHMDTRAVVEEIAQGLYSSEFIGLSEELQELVQHSAYWMYIDTMADYAESRGADR